MMRGAFPSLLGGFSRISVLRVVNFSLLSPMDVFMASLLSVGCFTCMLFTCLLFLMTLQVVLAPVSRCFTDQQSLDT